MSDSGEDRDCFGHALLGVTVVFAFIYFALGFTADLLVGILPDIHDGQFVEAGIALAFHALAWFSLYFWTVWYRPEPESGVLGRYQPSNAMVRYYKVWGILGLLLGIQLAVGRVIVSERFSTEVYEFHETTLFIDYASCCGNRIPAWLDQFYHADGGNRAMLMLLLQVALLHLIAAFISHFQFVVSKSRGQPSANWSAARSLLWAFALAVLSVTLLLHFYHSILSWPPLPNSHL